MHNTITAGIMLLMLILAGIIASSGDADGAVRQLPQQCSEKLAREVCCAPTCITYERRPNPAHADAQLAICWGAMQCGGTTPRAVEFCGCSKVLEGAPRR